MHSVGNFLSAFFCQLSIPTALLSVFLGTGGCLATYTLSSP